MTIANLIELVAFPEQAARWLIYLSLIDIFCLFCLFLVRKGKIQTASFLNVLGAWALTTIFTYSAGGIRAPIFIAYFLIIFMASIILGARAGLVAAAACGLTGLGFVYLEEIKLIPPLAVQHTPFSLWVVTSAFFMIMAVLQFITSSTIESSHEKTRVEMEERRRMESELRASEEKFRTVFATINDAIFISGLEDGNIFECNERLMGYARAELLGKSAIETGLWVTPQDRLNYIQLVQSQGQVEDFESVFRRKDHSTFIGSVSGGLVSMHNQVWLLSAIRDISGRKKAEKSLQESESKFRSFIEQALEGVVLQDEKGNILEWNMAQEKITGVKHAEAVGKSFWDVIMPFFSAEEKSPENLAYFKSLFTDILDSGMSPRFGNPMERIIHRPDGQLRFIRQVLFPIKTQTGNRIGAIISDITDRKEGEKALQESEEKFRAFIEQALEGFILSDENGSVIEFNMGIEKMTGLSRQDVTGKTLWEVMLPLMPLDRQTSSAFEQIRMRISEGLFTGQSPIFIAPFEGLMINAAGESKYIRQLAFPIKTAIGYRIGVIISDITERKKAEEKIRQFNTDLERRVQQRTAQLMISNQELEAFSYSVSHDLRAPLRSINGFNQILMDEYKGRVLDETALLYFQRIRTATHHMGQLIDDLLKLSQVTRSGIQLVTVDLSSLAHDLLDNLQHNSPDRKVQLNISEKLIVQADASLMHIAMDNLIANAWKYTQKSTPACIEIGSIQKDGQVVYYVRDNGAGFNMHFASKLFGAFQRLHTDKEFEGTGIGLAIVHRIISRHGGNIWAEGAVNQGATFYFTLP